MTARTHDLIAFSSLVTVATISPPSALNLYTLFACILGNVIGSQIPDMDQAGNRLWDLLPGGNNVGRILRKVFYKHRTITHSLLGLFVIYKLLDVVLSKIFAEGVIESNLLLISIMIGYVSHLIADSLTEEGIPLLFPFKFTFGFPPVKPWRMKTGKWFENLVVYPSVVAYLFIFIAENKDKLLDLIRLVT